MDPTLVPGTWFESQFQICVYEHVYISFFLSLPIELPPIRNILLKKMGLSTII